MPDEQLIGHFTRPSLRAHHACGRGKRAPYLKGKLLHVCLDPRDAHHLQQPAGAQVDTDAEVAATRQQYTAAVKEVLQIAEHDLHELRTYTRPPAAVEAVLAAVSVVLGLPTEWEAVLRHMHDTEHSLLARIKAFDVAQLRPAQIAQVANMLAMAELDPARARATSVAACSLCCWVHAVHRYALIDSRRQQMHARMLRLQRKQAAAQVSPWLWRLGCLDTRSISDVCIDTKAGLCRQDLAMGLLYSAVLVLHHRHGSSC